MARPTQPITYQPRHRALRKTARALVIGGLTLVISLLVLGISVLLTT